MKKLLSLIFAIGLFVSACGTTETQVALSAETLTPTLIPTLTQTPIPRTSTITPLPTIPTFTPTFDVSTIVTVTPAREKAECPKETSVVIFNPESRISVDSPNKQFTDYTLNFLNSGGAIKSIRASYKYPDGNILQKDLTGDSVAELIIAYGIWFDIFGCSRGKYQLMGAFTTDAAQGSKIIDVIDLNQNGLADMVGYFYGCLGFKCPSIDVYEWSGSEFKSLISVNSECWQTMPAPLEVEITDLDQNSTKEITLKHNGEPWPSGFGYPYRAILRICTWNGESIDLLSSEYVQPAYRYQALQDGDSAILAGDFPKALTLYVRVISDSTLEWFTEERNNYDFWLYRAEYFPSSGEQTPTQSPSLKPELSEYPSLAAYAYYRIMLLHFAQGQEAEAASTYHALRETFESDSYAMSYIEMATTFGEAYQPTKKMYDGCAAAIQYAVEHPEILIPLGSDYHGSQSKVYKPEDVCPFR